MRFRIDIYTATSAAPVGSPITEVLGIGISEKLNQIGEATITIPAHIAASRGLGRGYRYAIYHEKLGYLGIFKHIESVVDASAETITITAYDSLITLAERVAGFRRSFNDAQFNVVASTVFSTASLGSAWTISYEGVTLTDSITFSVEGENHLRIADYMRQYVRGWFRREGDTAIRFGKFSSTTPTLNFVAFSPTIGQVPSSQALITQITRTRQGGEVANRIYALGGGIGETKIDLRYSNRAATTSVPYAVTSSTIGTGVAGYYIEDTSSQATYGQIDRVIAWNEIRPITNSAADLQNAGNALYDIAAAYLQKYKSENDAYTLTAVNVPSTLRVGDLVRVVYNGVAELETGNIGWLNVANNFFVTDISRSFDASGQGPVTIGIAANGEAVVGDTEVLYDILQDVQTLKLRTQPTQTYFSKSYDTVIFQKGRYVAPSYSMRFGPEVLQINEMYMEVTIRPLVYPSITTSGTVDAKDAFASSAAIVSFSGATSSISLTTDSSGSHSHDLRINSAAAAANDITFLIGTPSEFRTLSAGGPFYVPTQSAGAHTHTISGHTHSFAHGHTLSSNGNHTHAVTSLAATIGATSGAVQTTSTVPAIAIGNFDLPEIYLSLTSVSSAGNTTILPAQSGYSGSISSTVIGTASVSTIEGFTGARINLLSPINYFAEGKFNWRNAYTQFEIYTTQAAACSVHVQFYGRVTIQPIAV